AGSSVPVTWRKPPLKLDKGCELTEAVMIGYGPFEGYGFHALEGLQCMAERRKGGGTGVKAGAWPSGAGMWKGHDPRPGSKAVRCLSGGEMWRAQDAGRWSKAILEAALPLVPAHAAGDLRQLTAKTADAGVFLIEYRDGFKAAVPMLNGWLHEGDGGAFIFA